MITVVMGYWRIALLHRAFSITIATATEYVDVMG